ncbi:MAG: glycoside hydrolase family 43 protein [Microbacteriaceae bacterium]|nr:glycoside hydrolase family 43 protein [Microbacteriaceae bacterium]
MTSLHNPLLPGFHPDPSIVAADGAYYLVNSTFEYLPGIPVHRSTDLENWEQVGNVILTPEVGGLREVATNGGVWAPTIRHHDGRFHIIVTIAMGRGCVVFSASDPAGPWDDGVLLPGIEGIDPDLAWDDAGTAIVTYSGLVLSGDGIGTHHGIRQADVDLATGELLSETRQLWSGSGFMFPEGPHLYRRDGFWYLLIAEGGTERGHGVSVARGADPRGPFLPGPANPILSARSTDRPVQNTGHADLVETPEGSLLVLLGVRPRGMTRAFSALGRETFVTRVHWGEDGWPVAEPVQLAPRPGETAATWSYAAPLDPAWLAVRRSPAEVVGAETTPERLVLHGEGTDMTAASPVFLGRRQTNQTAAVTVVTDAAAGVGGLAVRYDEENVYSLRAETRDAQTVVTAEARIPGVVQRWEASLPLGPVELELAAVRPGADGFGPAQMTSDIVRFIARSAGREQVLAEVDGRYLSAETAASFTGRVIGVFAVTGSPAFDPIRYRGSED